MTVYLKSFVLGIAGAISASILWTLTVLFLEIYLPFLIGRMRGTGGVASGYVGSGSIAIAALIGFIIAFVWEWHRLRAA